jgi:resorcinol 4-hydroxylase (NADPH)
VLTWSVVSSATTAPSTLTPFGFVQGCGGSGRQLRIGTRILGPIRQFAGPRHDSLAEARPGPEVGARDCMCGSNRDAAALTWRLDLILRGLADERLLDTYEGDRKPNAQGWTDLSREIGIPCITTDPEIAASRNAGMLAARSDPSLIQPMTVPPGPTAFARQCDPAAGLPAVQGQVRNGDATGLFDDVVGRGFTLLTSDRAALEALDANQRAFLDGIGARLAVIGAEGAGADIIDVDGTYANWFARLGRTAILSRPDFFVFGSAADSADTALVTSLRDQLAGTPATATANAPSVDANV